jgi:hypothetical protein
MQFYILPGVHHFADAYGTSAYGTCPYNSAATCSATSSNSGLVNTGIAVGMVVGVACLILLIAILVRFWRRSPKKGAQTTRQVEPGSDSELEKR